MIFNRIITKLNLRLRKKCKIYRGVELTNSNIDVYCNLSHHCSLNNAKIGKRTSIGRYSKLRDCVIGRYCSVSFDTIIGAVSHPIDRISSHAFTYRKQFGIVNQDSLFEKKETIIGNDVWIGCGVIILAGIHIGDGAVIGAGSVVTKDVEPYSIVCGVPAKEIRKRFDENTILELEKIKWWNKSDSWLKRNKKLFLEKLTKDTIEKVKREGE